LNFLFNLLNDDDPFFGHLMIVRNGIIEPIFRCIVLCKQLPGKTLLGIKWNLHFTYNRQVCIKRDKGILFDNFFTRLALNA
jgi:hypothetical protein